MNLDNHHRINERDNNNNNTITIWQQNVNKSKICQHDLISSSRLVEQHIDIVALQEPAISDFAVTIANKDWRVVYPSTHAKDPSKTRAVTLLRADIPTNKWSQIEIDSGDVTIVKITGEWGATTLFNIYNDCEHDDTIEKVKVLQSSLDGQDRDAPNESAHTIWLGDFNRHHPHWDDTSDIRLFTKTAINKAEKLISAVADAGLDLALPPKTPTHKHNVSKKWTRLDHVFLSEHSFDTLLSCEVYTEELSPNTDHLPIVTKLDLTLAKATSKSIANFRNVDWEKFRSVLEGQLRTLGLPRAIRNQGELDTECSRLTNAIQNTIQSEVPTIDLCPKSRRWWTKELTFLRREASRLGRKASKSKDRLDDPIHAESVKAKRAYERAIEYNKKHHWRDWLEKAEDPDIWTAHRYISAPASDGSAARIPTLKAQHNGEEVNASTNEDKSQLLARTFFPPKPTENARHEQEQDYPAPVCKMDNITRDQIRRHLAKLKPYKAPGPDSIPNIVLTKCANILIDRLYHVYTAIMNLGLYYDPWKQFTTVVLRKPGKPNYSVPKAYRPIALLNTLAKLLSAVIAEQLSYYAEKYNLLPPNHFGGRAKRTATDAVHLLAHHIKGQWRKRKVVSVLFLDIEGAFPNAVNEQLMHNLKTRRVPTKLIRYIANMLRDRTTTLRFDDHISRPIEINNGIGQGDPLSMALYQFYNADLVEFPKEDEGETAEAYVDDAIISASADSFEEAHEKIKDMMLRENGAISWAKKHNSPFEYTKLALIDFAHSSHKADRPPLVLPNITIRPSASTKYLGIILDQNLNWKEQAAYVQEKGSKWAAQIRRAARPSWGLTPKAARKLYIGVAIPRILYGADVWCVPIHEAPGEERRKGSVHAIRKLTTAQRAGTLAITGGYRTSPTDTLDAHASILPMHLKIGKVLFRAAVRLAALPDSHPLRKQYRLAGARKTKRHKSALHHMTQLYGIRANSVETIPVVRQNPAERNLLPANIEISMDKAASVQLDANSTETIKVYSDGSAHNGKVGAAAVLIRRGKADRVLRLCLGTTEQHTVPEAESVGLILGLHLIATEKRNRKSCAIGLDSQAAIRALQTELTSPGHHLTAEALRIAKHLRSRNGNAKFNLTIRWTAGHVGIEGNEKADKEAKRAAEGNSSNTKDLPRYVRKIKHSVSALRQANNKERNETWKKAWQVTDRYKRFSAKDTASPASQKFLSLISDHRISRRMASLIFQLRAGHAPLNSYLHRFQKVDSARCPACGDPRETAEHFLLRCPKYAHERWPLLAALRRTTPSTIDLLSNPKTIIPLINYIEATERFRENKEGQQVTGAEVQEPTRD
jgi:ribonuclease HI